MFIFQFAQKPQKAHRLQVSEGYSPLSELGPSVLEGRKPQAFPLESLGGFFSRYGIALNAGSQSSFAVNPGRKTPFHSPRSAEELIFRSMDVNTHSGSIYLYYYDPSGQETSQLDFGPQATRRVKEDWNILPARQWQSAYQIPAGSFENGAGAWSEVSTLMGATRASIEAQINSTGSYAMSWADQFGFNYTYTATGIQNNKLSGSLVILDPDGNPVSTEARVVRLSDLEDLTGVRIFTTPSNANLLDIQSRTTVFFYMESLPDASDPANWGSIYQAMASYVQDNLGHNPQVLGHGWFNGGPSDYHKMICMAVIDHHSSGQDVVTVVGFASSDSHIRDGFAGFSVHWGVLTQASFGPDGLSATVVDQGLELGHRGIGGSPRYMLSSDEPPSGLKDPIGAIPQATFLGHPHPNPLNSSTTIPYTVQKEGHVKIEIFNSLGQSVALLTDDPHMPGKHEVRFDASNLPSGVYFCRMAAGDTQESKKLMVVK